MKTPSFETQAPKSRAVLLGVQLPDMNEADLTSSLDELARLGKTLGLEIVGRITQKRAQLAPGAVVGEGKLKELAELTGGRGTIPVGPPASQRKRGKRAADDESESEPEEDASSEADAAESSERSRKADVVLVDHDLTPSQARNLELATSAEVLDRSAVILAIFQRHARSREARLQVEIARLSYMAPRLRESSAGRDRQGGGIGGRGAGESHVELDRRKVRDRIAELRAELAEIEKAAGTRRKRRGDQPTVALVGYTNAGKSSWMRVLTASSVLVEDKLFATLDTTVRALQPDVQPRILISDTVGFIKKLPHDLVASFRSTLDEARECDLLLHVVDASDPSFPAQVQVTRDVLDEIGATESPRWVLLNKADRLTPEERARIAAEWPEALFVSVREPKSVEDVRGRVREFFERDTLEEELFVPYSKQRVVAEARAGGRVLSERHDETGTFLTVRARPALMNRLKEQLDATRAAAPD